MMPSIDRSIQMPGVGSSTEATSMKRMQKILGHFDAVELDEIGKLTSKRKQAIAAASGHTVEELNMLIFQFEQVRVVIVAPPRRHPPLG
jgi:signal recognition particle GTPase